jgi:polysaccharide biosynthesis/export protein
MKNLPLLVVLLSVPLALPVSAQVSPGGTHPNSLSRARVLGTPGPMDVSIESSNVASPATQLYRVGIGDVLDVQLPQTPTTKSTLYTVLAGGVIDYPLAGEPLLVAGLTPQEICERLRQRIRVLDRPVVKVNVRDYASHTVTVIGFVSAPGVKTLRREAVPLYALLAEAVPLAEATDATITRAGQALKTIDLKDNEAISTLVQAGDVVKVQASTVMPAEFFFIGGAINSPGQKEYHSGITLTQAILASGGLRKSSANKARVSRQVVDGRLVTVEYNLREIQNGKLPDPVLQKDDRLEISIDE